MSSEKTVDGGEIVTLLSAGSSSISPLQSSQSWSNSLQTAGNNSKSQEFRRFMDSVVPNLARDELIQLMEYINLSLPKGPEKKHSALAKSEVSHNDADTRAVVECADNRTVFRSQLVSPSSTPPRTVPTGRCEHHIKRRHLGGSRVSFEVS